MHSDYAGMCKHVAATMYGVGNRLDSAPELPFTLRCVDHMELIEQAVPAAPLAGKGTTPVIAAGDLGAIFSIEIGGAPLPPTASGTPKKATKKAVKKPAKKSTVAKKKSAPKKG